MRRSNHVSPWHNCTRCGIKTHIKDMVRQLGILICTRKTCYDEQLVGQRDANIAKILNQVAASKEMQPDDLISNPNITGNEEIFF